MARSFLLSLALYLIFFHASIAQQQQQAGCHCEIDNLTSREPDNTYRSQGGVTESWDHNHKEFRCSGVAVVRRTVHPNGLVLPFYSNAPQLIYIVKGRGVLGVTLPGCAETFQESQQSREGSRGGFRDQHQKVRRFRDGDIIAVPAGAAYWSFNDGNEPVVSVTLLDVTNRANQLDNNPRKFYLAGSPQNEFLSQGGSEYSTEHYEGNSNLFYGLSTRIIAEAFNIDESLAWKLKAEGDSRGQIVIVKEGLQLVGPYTGQQEQFPQYGEGGPEGGQCGNGIEETLCSLSLIENIGDPSRADLFNPDAGRVSTVDSHSLPVLRLFRLSAERGVLYGNSMVLPHWNRNAHSIIYVIRGQARIQVVNQNGRAVFDGEARQGQVLVVPQNFVVVKLAEQERFEWVAFKTNDRAETALLAGRTSSLRAFPVEVIANAFGISSQEARRIKFNNGDTTLSSVSRSRSGSRAVA